MKKLFSLLTLALLTMSAWGTTVTFDYTTDTGDWTAAGEFSVTKDNVTLAFSNGTINAAYRVYAKSTLTISSAANNITQIEFTCTSSNPASNFAALDGFDTSTGIWTGDAASVEFTASTQVRATQIVVTLSDGGETPVVNKVAAPVFNPADGYHFTGSLAVTVSSETENASIQLYKVVDGEFVYDQDFFPGQDFTFYVTETTQYAAYAYKNGMDNSDTTYVTYTLDNDNPDPQVNDYIEFNHADDAQTSAGEYTVTRNGASFTVSNGMVAAESYRMYKTATITFTSTVGNIVKIEFDGVNSDYKISNFGTVEGMTYDGNNGTWVGNAATVTFTATEAQVRASVIRVYVDGEVPVTVMAPTFDPSDGSTFTETLDVTINCSTEGATIHYVVGNGDEQTGTAPIVVTLDETTTITAYAELEGVESDIVEATYTKEAAIEPDVVFTSTDDKGDGSSTTSAWTVEKDGVTMACSSGRVYDEGYRIYQGSTLTFTSTIGNIIKIEFDGVESYPISRMSANVGNLATSGVNGTWTGKSVEVVFTASQQARATEIRIYVDGDTTAIPAITVASPVITPAHNTTFAGSLEVSITCETEDAEIYYSTDNETWTKYEAPFPITETCTVYAYAQVDTVKSATVSAKYYLIENEVDNIAEANALNVNDKFMYNGEATVTYQWKNPKNQYYSTWIKDATGSGLIYGKNVPELAQGTVLKDGWDATFTTYNSIPEYTYPNNVAASEDVVTVTPEEKTAITVEDVNMYVILKGQTVVADATDTTGLSFYNADSLVIYNQFGVELPTFEEGKTYDVVGIATIYKSAPELYIISATEVATQTWELGDVNHSGGVDIEDVTALINAVLGTPDAEYYPEQADCNGDNGIDIEDVTALINRVLNGSF